MCRDIWLSVGKEGLTCLFQHDLQEVRKLSQQINRNNNDGCRFPDPSEKMSGLWRKVEYGRDRDLFRTCLTCRGKEGRLIRQAEIRIRHGWDDRI